MKIKLIVLLLAIACSPIRALAEGPREVNRLIHEGVVAAPVKDVWAGKTLISAFQ